MNDSRWVLRCAAIGSLVLLLRISAQAQSPFAEGPAGVADDPAAHAKTAEKSLLADAPGMAKAGKDEGQDFCKCVGDGDSAAVERIERALRGPLHSAGIDFTDTPLQDVVSSLQDDFEIPIQLDAKAMEEAGIGTDAPVTINLHNISLQAALRLMLKKLDLKYVIEDEVLLITTNEAAEAKLKTCVYDVSSISGERDAEMDSIIDMIASCVATDTWSENGGGGAEIRPIKPGLLVISQTRAVHEEIHSLLATLRKMHGASAGDSAAPKAAHAKAEKVVTRSYMLRLNPTNEVDTMRSQVRDLITQSLPGETWSGQLDSGDGVTLTVFHDRVVVRHKPEVQDKVQQILMQSGIALPATSGDEMGHGEGFAPGSGPEGGAAGVPGAVPGAIGPGGFAPTFQPDASPGGPEPSHRE